jgi:uncharacterized damage-inducible protein DinB
MDNLRYPIGQFEVDTEITDDIRNGWIDEIAETPRKLRKALEGLTQEQIDTPYRPGGWTVRQVVHHLPDSHLNGYLRFKLALTEEQPTIKPIFEDRWAKLEDSRVTDIETSLVLLEVLHQRWITLLRSLNTEDFYRTFNNPESGILTLNTALGLYAWHGQHHIAHITSLLERMGWK